MSKSTILTLAAICGLIAFLVTVLSQPPRGRSQRGDPDFRGRGGGGGVGAVAAGSDLPFDLEDLETRIAQTPNDVELWFRLATVRHAERLLPGAREAWESVIRLAAAELERVAEPPSRPQPRRLFQIAWANHKLGNADEARLYAAKAEQLYTDPNRPPRWNDNPTIYHRIGWLRTIQEDHAAARQAWARAAELQESRTPAPDREGAYTLACYLALAGDSKRALDMLALAQTLGFDDADRAQSDDDLASLRGDPAFQAILQRMTTPRLYRDG